MYLQITTSHYNVLQYTNPITNCLHLFLLCWVFEINI